eukprot:NODE_3767_length_1989_cov_5.149839.p1 GENE.NODE_3767_length_1989_cov_5.149839~~NODE_3767_length_1989_cov_5.149839.p1  ORF type:complete len:585 (+),score=85.52 NODE_3767_length_1989_cov_5.149839:202-1956(+)
MPGTAVPPRVSVAAASATPASTIRLLNYAMLPPREPADEARRGGFFHSLTALRRKPPAFDPVEHALWAAAAQAVRDEELAVEESLAGRAFLSNIDADFIIRFAHELKTFVQGAAATRTAEMTVSLRDFLRVCKPQLRNPTPDDDRFLRCLFCAIDRWKHGVIATVDIATGLVLICNEDKLSKMRCLFQIFNKLDSQCLMFDEIFEMFRCIKTIDITKSRRQLVTDLAFNDELSLQEAKRLYEVVVSYLRSDNTLVVYEEFMDIFLQRPHLLDAVLPGTFSLEWMFAEYSPPTIERTAHTNHAVHEFTQSLRCAEEHLEISEARGRGHRVMSNCLDFADITPGAPDSHQLALPKLTSSAMSHHPSSSTPSRQKAPPRTGHSSSATRRGRESDLTPTASADTFQTVGYSATNISSVSDSAVGSLQFTGGQIAATLSTPRRCNNSSDDAVGGGSGRTLAIAEDECEGTDDIGKRRSTDGLRGRGSCAGAASHSQQQNTAELLVLNRLGVVAEVPPLPLLRLNHEDAKRFRKMPFDKKAHQAFLHQQKAMARMFKHRGLLDTLPQTSSLDFSKSAPDQELIGRVTCNH